MTNQTRLRLKRAGGGVLAASALCLFAPAAGAQTAPACSTLPHLVLITGSSAAKPFIAAIAASLKADPATPISIAYIGGKASCDGVGGMTTPAVTFASVTASTWTGTGAAPVENTSGCAIDAAGSEIDIGAADVYAKTCGLANPLATDVKDYHGPVQSMNFVVPGGSSQVSISQEAAYLAFGLGNDAGAGVPWDDISVHEVRKSNSGTMLMTGAVIGVPGTRWLGNANADTKTVLAQIATDITNGKVEKTIGIMSSGDADANRSVIRQLNFQQKAQTCGYTPDSDSTTSFDKANTRSGQYSIWGPLHLYVHTTSGKPTNPDVAKVIDYLTGAVDPDFDLITVEAKSGVVPDCAMRASRGEDGGAISSYMPAKSCECKFIAATGSTVPAACTTCNTKDDCKKASAPACNYGFCEVQ